MRQFKYGQCLDTLGGERILETARSSQRLMRLMGRQCREDREDGWTTISSAVHHSLEILNAEPSGDSAQPAPGLSPVTTNTSNGDRLHERPRIVEAFRYTMALKEHCDQRAVLMSYDEECLQAYPPSFEATVHVQGLSFSGTGTTKKMARHGACRQACTEMGIEP